jgi:hypothetical protein
MQALLGSYSLESNSSELIIDKSENISAKEIQVICERLIDEKVEILTLEFDDDNFIYFKRFNDIVRFVEGPMTDYVHLQQLVRNDLSGKIHRVKAAVEGESKKQDKSAYKSTSEVVQIIHEDEQHNDNKETRLIHNALFTPLQSFKRAYSNAELYFKPFEAPDGDFYWFKDYQYKSLVVVGDCTGHGMQGALIVMSILTLLKQFFQLPPLGLKSSIADFYKQLNNIQEEESNGIFDAELGLVLIDKRSNQIDFIGSGINMIVKSNSNTQMLSTRKSKLIQNKQEAVSMKLNMGDQLFIFSDGISDQFDASADKKLGSRNLLNLVKKLQNSSIQGFSKEFNDFRGATKAMDDQTMLLLTV